MYICEGQRREPENVKVMELSHTFRIIEDYNPSYNTVMVRIYVCLIVSYWMILIMKNFINNNCVINSMITFNSLLHDKINLFFY